MTAQDAGQVGQRGYVPPQLDTPPVISPYAQALQVQDEKGSVPEREPSAFVFIR